MKVYVSKLYNVCRFQFIYITSYSASYVNNSQQGGESRGLVWFPSEIIADHDPCSPCKLLWQQPLVNT